MPDADKFGRVIGSRGKRACAAIARVLQGTVNEHDAAPIVTELLTHLWKQIGGVRQLGQVLSVLERQRHPQADLYGSGAVLDRLEVAGGNDSRANLILVDVAQRAALDGITDRSAVCTQFVRELLMYHLIEARGGILERLGARMYQARKEQINALLDPVTVNAGALLAASPNRRTLSMRSFVPGVSLEEELV